MTTLRFTLPACRACSGEGVRHYIQTGGGRPLQVTPDERDLPCDEPGCVAGKIHTVPCTECDEDIDLCLGEEIYSGGLCAGCAGLNVDEDGGEGC
jgi:hypothetical protein